MLVWRYSSSSVKVHGAKVRNVCEMCGFRFYAYKMSLQHKKKTWGDYPVEFWRWWSLMKSLWRVTQTKVSCCVNVRKSMYHWEQLVHTVQHQYSRKFFGTAIAFFLRVSATCSMVFYHLHPTAVLLLRPKFSLSMVIFWQPSWTSIVPLLRFWNHSCTVKKDAAQHEKIVFQHFKTHFAHRPTQKVRIIQVNFRPMKGWENCRWLPHCTFYPGFSVEIYIGG